MLGEEHPHARSMNNLATALDDAGQHAEAIEMHRTTLSVRRVLGEEHPATLDSMNNLAKALNAAGQHAEALAMQRSTLRRCAACWARSIQTR